MKRAFYSPFLISVRVAHATLAVRIDNAQDLFIALFFSEKEKSEKKPPRGRPSGGTAPSG